MAVKKSAHRLAMHRIGKKLDGRRIDGALRAFRQRLADFVPRGTRPDATASVGRYNPVTVSLFGLFVVIDRPNQNLLWSCDSTDIAESMFATVVRNLVAKKG